MLAIAVLVLEARIDATEGKSDAAVELLRQAVTREDAPPTPSRPTGSFRCATCSARSC